MNIMVASNMHSKNKRVKANLTSSPPKANKTKKFIKNNRINISEELEIFQHIVNSLGDEVFVTRLNGDIVYVNDAAIEDSGHAKKYLLNRNFLDFLYEKISLKTWYNRYIFEIRKSKKSSTFLLKRVTKSGKIQTLEFNAACMHYNSSEYILIAGRNITEHIALIDDLRESEKLYRQLCEQSNDGICTLSLGGKIIYANKAAEEMVKVKFFKGKYPHFSKYLDLHSVQKIKNLFKKIKMGERVFFEKANILDKNGKIIPVEISSFPDYKNDKIFQVHCMFRDISKRSKMESLFLESQKMKALQLFIAGTTYEIDNPLKGLLTRAQNLIEKYKDRNFEYIGYKEYKDIINSLMRMREQIKYCCETTKRLIDINKRKVNMQNSSCNVNKVVTETIKMFEHELEVSNVKLITKLSANLPKSNISRVDLAQVLGNVFTNAIQSMLAGNEIVVRTSFLKKENKISVACIDQGIGISKEILPHVFEPFFTTKQRGLRKNAGLGLSIVYSIIKSVKGEITISSSPKQGTTVRIFLPIDTK